jgi:hypothetical protein
MAFMNATCLLPAIANSIEATVKLEREAQESEHENVRICIIGSKRGIYLVIRILSRHGFASIDAWSVPQPTENSGEYISILLLQLDLD